MMLRNYRLGKWANATNCKCSGYKIDLEPPPPPPPSPTPNSNRPTTEQTKKQRTIDKWDNIQSFPNVHNDTSRVVVRVEDQGGLVGHGDAGHCERGVQQTLHQLPRLTGRCVLGQREDHLKGILVTL